MPFWKQNKANEEGISFAWESSNGTKRKGTKNMLQGWPLALMLLTMYFCYFPQILSFLIQRQLKIVKLSTTSLCFVWIMLVNFKFCIFVLVFNLFSSRSSPNPICSGAWVRAGWWGPRLHTQERSSQCTMTNNTPALTASDNDLPFKWKHARNDCHAFQSPSILRYVFFFFLCWIWIWLLAFGHHFFLQWCLF